MNQLISLKGLQKHLVDIHVYLTKVLKEELPVNHAIIYNLQDMFNLLPNINVLETAKAFAVQTNDEMMVIYLSGMIRSIIALHNLIENKGMLRDAESTPEEIATKEKNDNEKVPSVDNSKK
jgi:26S proteasome regulatory subunit N8